MASGLGPYGTKVLGPLAVTTKTERPLELADPATTLLSRSASTVFAERSGVLREGR